MELMAEGSPRYELAGLWMLAVVQEKYTEIVDLVNM
jgi:hypothetical protein